MRKVKISVIMSVYNTPASILFEAVESIWNQTYRKIEFIMVNDCSDEKETITAISKIMTKYPQIILLQNKSNLGLTRSLNKGIEYCTGEYIARMDADDISNPDRFMMQVHYMETHSEVCVLGTQVEKFGMKSTKQPFEYYDYTVDQNMFSIKMLFENFGPMHPTVMIRKSFLEKHHITYREEFRMAQDYALWVDCLNAGGVIKNLDIPLVQYRIHEGQISEKNSSEQSMFKRKVIEMQIKQLFGDFPKNYLKVYSSLYDSTYEVQPAIYIEALKELMFINIKKSIYNNELFVDEVRRRWIHKCFKCFIKGKDIRGFFKGYTWKCLFSMSFPRWVREEIWLKQRRSRI